MCASTEMLVFVFIVVPAGGLTLLWGGLYLLARAIDRGRRERAERDARDLVKTGV